MPARIHGLLLPLLVTALLAAAGCTTLRFGAPFDLERFKNEVRKDVTTQAEVESWLGPPAGVGHAVDSSGRRFVEWTYYYGGGTLPRLQDASLKVLQIKFDQQGIVRAYNWSQNR